MTSYWTIRGARRVLGAVFQGESLPTNFYIALVKASPAPSIDTVTLSQLTQIANGNGYVTGGISLDRNSADFDQLLTDNTEDKVIAQLRDIVWTASSGAIPASGDGARYAVLTTDDATPADREIWWVFDLNGTRIVSEGQAITLIDMGVSIDVNDPAA